MIKKIDDYTVQKIIFEKNDIVIYQVLNDQKKPVFIKTLKDEYPSIEQLSKFKKEYEIFKKIDSPHVIKPISIQRYKNSYLAFFEAVEGLSLKNFLPTEIMTNALFFNLAVGIAKAFNEVHQHEVVVKELNPYSIFINPETLSTVLIDLGSASTLEEFAFQKSPDLLLNYISPELTGRMHRKVDFRSDIYSLGILFYEILTGVLPFINQDPLEIIHSHVVMRPKSPYELDDLNSPQASSIIMKCISKIPEDRYQSIQGLISDLEYCQKSLKEKGSIDPFFSPGQLDVNETFKIPERLYGRERELFKLDEAYKRVMKGAKEWCLITGYAGIGKTELVKEFHKTDFLDRGWFVKGKFEFLQHHIPFSGLIQAFRMLVHLLLKEKEEQLIGYRRELLSSLQVNGQVLIDFIPELELIIGKQPGVIKLSGEDNRNRFFRTLMQFIKVFASKEHPLVVFLDDLQWADSASLNCIKDLLLDDRLKYLLFIGAYRPQDVPTGHPLSLILNDIKKEQVALSSIELNQLTIGAIQEMLIDILQCTKENSKNLAELLYSKTQGNPFFLTQLLKKLHEEQLINFNREERVWKWNLEEIKLLDISENVVDLMLQKINQFKGETKDILSLAAAIGPRFSLNLIGELSGLYLKEVATQLLPVLSDDLIHFERPYPGFEQLLKEDDEKFTTKLKEEELYFIFTHNKIHQAFDSLSTDEGKLNNHYKIGTYFKNQYIKNKDEGVLQEGNRHDLLLFELLSQLNFSKSKIQDSQERIDLASLNLEGCLKAKDSSAYSLAYELITEARELLPKNAWEENYELTYKIYLESTECAFLQKKFEQGERFSDEILQHARTKNHKGKLYLVKMGYYTNTSDYIKVIKLGLDCAELYGYKIPADPALPRILFDLALLRFRIRKMRPKDFEDLPPCLDEDKIFFFNILVMLSPACYLYNKHLFVYIHVMALNYMLDYGNTEHSSFLYIGYTGILLNIFKDYEQAHEFAVLSINMAEKTNNHKACCRSYFLMALVVNHWTHPIKESLAYLKKCYLHGLDSGELFFLSYVTVFFGFGDGTYYRNLNESQIELQRYSSVLYSAKNAQAILSHRIRAQYLKQMCNPAFRGYSFTDVGFDEEEFHKKVRDNNQFKPVYQGYVTFKSMALNYFGYYEEGVEIFEKSFATREAINSFMTERDMTFFHSLNLAGIYETAPFFKKLQIKRKIKKNQKLFKIWVDHCSSNNLHRYLLVEAELAKITGHLEKALDLYDQAIKAALDNDFPSELALANELAGKTYLKLNKVSVAKAYLRESHYHYYRWGCLAKTSQLEEFYPQFIEERAEILQKKNLEKNELEDFGMSAVVKTSNLLSKEISFEKLLSEILRVLIVEAGADRALFIMQEEDKWIIQGEKRARDNLPHISLSLPIDNEQERLSLPIINFVIRTEEKVIINDVNTETIFKNDTYLKTHHIKAVLCLPIIHQGSMAALLYLENTEAKDVFSEEKIRILELLSGQIATSIENSILYRRLETYNKNLEDKVLERTDELLTKNDVLADTLQELKHTQNHLIESEKMAALGQLIAGIAHEVNTPLGAVKASAQNAREAIKEIMFMLPELDKLLKGKPIEPLLDLAFSSIDNAKPLPSFEEERTIKKGMTQRFEQAGFNDADQIAELFYDMGTTSQDVDLWGVYKEDLLPLLNFSYNLASNLRNNQNILVAVERASKIIFALKAYLRSENKEAFVESDLVEGLQSVLILYQHQMKNEIDLVCHFDPIPLIFCRINELNQVWTNLIHNALQAMKNKGRLEIKIYKIENEEKVAVEIIDSGEGIAEEIQSRLFTPFFTTKPKGEGSGLGLSISSKIIEAHKGEITFDSTPGRTRFIVKLPINP